MTPDEFIARWTGGEGGAERANYVMFLTELCAVIGVGRPDPAGATSQLNDYVFERAVRPRDSADTHAPQRIDLYKKGCFILEAKQSRLPGKKNEIPNQERLALDEPAQLGRRSVAKGWDVMMLNARKQAEQYVFLLDTSQPAPPFLIVCDVGHCLELYADFTGTGRAYGQFPDRRSFRIYLEDLRDEAVRERLRQVWTDPQALDLTKRAATVTRDIARRLADVSKALENNGCNAEDVAHFLMRCLFTMFTEDVELLPKDSFKTLLAESREKPEIFARSLKALWKQMDEGDDYSFVIRARVRRFNGGLFKNTTAFELKREEIGELLAAAQHDWKAVDPAIFGTLLEQALDKTERRKLGAHYTPRAYVQRLVDVTIMEPLRADWQAALTRAKQAKEDGDEKKAVAAVRAFHHQLCTTRVLDPACGTGNFLYVALELMKNLEGEVLEVLAELGEPENMGLDHETVDPHQFLGLEINPRAAAIAELVIWLGYLQQHYRTRTGHPSEPILRDFKNINFGQRGGYDAVLTWDGYPVPKIVERDGTRVPTYPNARRPEWPEAEFIVGNPPFLGKGEPMREALGQAYLQELWRSYCPLNESADFVMFWWDRAAGILKQKQSKLKRFGLVSTNSITQVFNRRVIERHKGKDLSIIFAVPNQSWLKSGKDPAMVRVAITVSERGILPGRRYAVESEENLDTDEPIIVFRRSDGMLNSDLTIGADVTKAVKLKANFGISSNGVLLAGRDFLNNASFFESLFEHRANDIGSFVKPYLNGRALKYALRPELILDFSKEDADYLRRKHPRAYQYLYSTVREERSRVYFEKKTPDAKEYLERWWQFAKPRKRLRESLASIPRYIGTNETTKYRYFQFIPANVVPDHMIVVVASADAALLAVCSSRTHVLWANRAGGRQGVGNDPRYTKSRTFDPFPYPCATPTQTSELRDKGEHLDALRKATLADHPKMSMTDIYNVLEKIRASSRAERSDPGAVRLVADGRSSAGSWIASPAARKDGSAAMPLPLTAKEEDIKDRCLVLILKELHEEIDRLTAEAYGWPVDLSDDEILARLVALNAERAKEEAAGLVRWLRPEYQIPRFGKAVQAKTGELDLPESVVAIDAGMPVFPTDAGEAALAVEALLAKAGAPMTAAAIARGFKRGGKRVEQKVVKALTTLVRYGHVTALDGEHYLVRRAA